MKTSRDKWSVYALMDPRTNKPFYIGQTKNAKHRHQAHCGPKAHRYAAKNMMFILQELHWLDLKPEFLVLAKADTLEEAKKLEKDYIRQALDAGYRIFNKTGLGQHLTETEQRKLDSLDLRIIEMYVRLRKRQSE